MAANTIRIRLKAFDHRILDQTVKKIVETARRTGARISGPVPLPTEKAIHCIVKPTALGRSSRTMEHYEIRTHKRFIDILDSTPRTVDALTRLDLPGGVHIHVRVSDRA